MNTRIKGINRYLGILLFVLFLSSHAISQTSLLQVIGVAEFEMSPISDAKVTLFKDGQSVQSVITDRRGEFKFTMDINSEYVIQIEKQGLLSKKIAFNTEIPSELSGKWTMEFAMSLFPSCEGVNSSVLNDPVDRVKYSTNKADFISDEAYVRNMRGRIENLLIDIDNCQSEKYQEAMSEGEKLLREGNYAAAQDKFQEALEIYPDDRTAQRKIAETEKGMGESQQDERAYNQAVAEADRLYAEKDYEGAKAKYSEALRRKQDSYAQDKVTELDKIINEQRQADQAKAEIERNYNSLISQANSAYTRKDYASAKRFYEQALVVKPGAAFPQQKVVELDPLIAQQKQNESEQQAIQKSYTEAIAMGQSALASKDYEAAKQHFNRAVMMKPEESFPRQKISEIDEVVSEQRQANAQAQKAATQQKIDDALDEGEALLAQNNYDGAEAAFQRALSLDPNDTFAKQQLQKTRSRKANELAEKQRAMEKSFNNAVDQGDQLASSGSYDKAVEAYKQALLQKPNDQLALNKLQAAEQKLAEQRQQQMNEQAKRREYDNYLAAGNRSFDAKQYTQAKESYQQALSLFPSQATPRSRINEIDQILGQQQKEEEYKGIITRADGLYAAKNYEAAKSGYQQALALKSNDPYPRQKVAEIDQIYRENARLESEKKQMEEQYARTIAEGDNLLAMTRLNEAKAAYQRALSLKSGEQYPQQQIVKIEGMLAEQLKKENDKKALDKQYADLISRANGLFDSKNYDQAKAAYQQALAMKGTEAYPKQRITEIDQLLQEQQRQAREQQMLDQQYAQVVGEADNLFNASKLQEAKSAYQRALGIKASESHPRQQIAKIDGLIAEQLRRQNEQKQAEEKQYTDLINRANGLFDSKDYAQSKLAYQQALAMRGTETYPKQRITEIDQLLQEQQRQAREQQMLDQQYAQVVGEADNLFNASKLQEAKSAYQRALGIKASESHPKQQIAKIDGLIAEQLRRQSEQKQAEEKQYTDLINRANGLFDSKNYAQSKLAYQQALAMRGTETYPKQRITEIDGLIQEQQRQAREQQMRDQQYAQIIKEADNLFGASKLPEAKSAYQRALGIKSSEAHPQQQIVKIDGIIAEQARKENEQKAKEMQYKQSIDEADQAYSQNNLAQAKTSYQRALGIKAGESYPTGQIAKIDQQLARLEKERQEKAAFEQKYSSLIASADKSFDSRDYPKAKRDYTEALKLKPGESHPQGQLRQIAEFERILAVQEANRKTSTTTTAKPAPTSSSKSKKLAELNFANDSERDKYLNSLRGQYPSGVTLEVHKEKTLTTYRYIVIRDSDIREFRKVRYNYGDVEYKENGIPVSGMYFEQQVKVRSGEFSQEFNY